MKKKKGQLTVKELRSIIIREGGVVPRGCGDSYKNYLKLIVTYKDKVKPPLNK